MQKLEVVAAVWAKLGAVEQLRPVGVLSRKVLQQLVR